MTWGVVVLTQGRRPEELRRALASVLAQDADGVDVVVVGNGWEPEGLPEGVRGVALPADRGIPAGRNAGVPHVRGELLLFLDDDASLGTQHALGRLEAMFAADPALGLVQPRVEPLDGGAPPRDWVPRLRVGDRRRSSDLTAVWEGAVAIPRRVFEQAGGWPEAFVATHEGIDLAWRVMDTGHRVRYAAEVAVLHRAYATAPHAYSRYLGARNRVWLARRHLPLPLAAVYVSMFALRTLPLLRSWEHVQEAARGYRDGLREPCGERRPLRARTLWRMTRAGRPPIL
jgi:GT2 family glycosyltransferase